MKSARKTAAALFAAPWVAGILALAAPALAQEPPAEAPAAAEETAPAEAPPSAEESAETPAAPAAPETEEAPASPEGSEPSHSDAPAQEPAQEPSAEEDDQSRGMTPEEWAELQRMIAERESMLSRQREEAQRQMEEAQAARDAEAKKNVESRFMFFPGPIPEDFVIDFSPKDAAAKALLAGYAPPSRHFGLLRRLAETVPSVLQVRPLIPNGGPETPLLATLALDGDWAPQDRPAMLVVAGLDGSHLVGVETAARFIAYMVRQASGPDPADPELAELLQRRTIYVVPCLNPEAVQKTFDVMPRRAWPANARPDDDDNDGLVDEDGPDDINGDSLITQMRVERPDGRWQLDAEDPRAMTEARPDKGDRGGWLLLSEGSDDDGDGEFNEDGPGGTNLAQNWPFEYPWHQPGAGPHPISEPAARALADFVVHRRHIGLVVVLGRADNLAQTLEGEERPMALPGPVDPIKTPDKDDARYLAQLGREWREAVGLKKEGKALGVPGDFADWMYFHRGRLALKTPVWTPALQMAWEKDAQKEEASESPALSQAASPEESADLAEAKDETAFSDAEKKDDDKKDDTPEAVKTEREFLAWLDARAPRSVVPWKPFRMADFLGRRVEIGGVPELARINPPGDLLEPWIERQIPWLASLAGKMPEVQIIEPSARLLSDDIWEIEFRVRNDGALPTVLFHGERSNEVMPVWADIDLPAESFLGGKPKTRLPRLAPGESVEVRAIVTAEPGMAIQLRARSAHAGRAEASVTLQR